MHYLNKFSTAIAITGLGTVLATGINGCGETQEEKQPQAKNAFVIIEETEKGKYKIKDEFPAEETRIVLKKLDGTEEVLTKEQLDKLIEEENAKIEAGTSNLTQPQATQSGGMGLGETILASAAGAMLGAWIGSKLFGNQNYQNNRQSSYKSPSTYSKSQSSFSKGRTSSTTKKSGFFGGKSSSSSRTSSFGG